jgi:sodium/hydrogen exchanger-like protein 6/7
LGNLDHQRTLSRDRQGVYSSGNVNGNAGTASNGHTRGPARRNSARNLRSQDAAEQGLLDPVDSGTTSQAEEEDDGADLDLPPAARRIAAALRSDSPRDDGSTPGPYPTSGQRAELLAAHETSQVGRLANTTGAISQLFSDISEDPSSAFRHIDEGFIKPRLLLDPGNGQGSGGSGQ